MRTEQHKDETENSAETDGLKHRSDAIIHKLIERADTWGRKEHIAIKRRVTDTVKSFSGEETKLIAGCLASFKDKRKSAESKVREKMRSLQEELNRDLKKLESEREAEISSIRAKYRESYNQAEEDIALMIGSVSDLIADFSRELPKLDIDLLMELDKNGVVKLGGGNYLVQPGRADTGKGV